MLDAVHAYAVAAAHVAGDADLDDGGLGPQPSRAPALSWLSADAGPHASSAADDSVSGETNGPTMNTPRWRRSIHPIRTRVRDRVTAQPGRVQLRGRHASVLAGRTRIT